MPPVAGLLLGPLLAACAPQACRLTLAERLPITVQPRTGKLLVDASVENKPVRLLVDTGSETTLLDFNQVEGSQIGAAAFINGIGGSRAGRAERAHLQLGRLSGDVFVVTTGLPKGQLGPGVAGLLGMNILGAYDVDIDLAGRQLRFFSQTGDCAQAPVALDGTLYDVPILSPPGDLPAIRIDLTVDGTPLRGLLDTGASGLLLTRSGAARMRLSAATNGPALRVTGVGRGSIPARPHNFAAVDIGTLTIHNVRGIITNTNLQPGVDFLLGIDFAYLVHLWIANTSHALVMQFPPRPSPPLSTADAGR